VRIHRILACSKANGPGSRFVVWVQGCNRHCSGCFNPDAQPSGGGSEMDITTILSGIDPECVSGLTVSGGEPFEQPEALKDLLQAARNRGLNTLVYTGYTWEELWARREPALQFCDYLIDGPYEQGNPPRCGWSGSGNQRFLVLCDGVITEDRTERESCAETGEIYISEDGTVISTGIYDGRL
jgi:anaerobic ribonucleoside-triphosphate reductase activating protein